MRDASVRVGADIVTGTSSAPARLGELLRVGWAVWEGLDKMTCSRALLIFDITRKAAATEETPRYDDCRLTDMDRALTSSGIDGIPLGPTLDSSQFASGLGSCSSASRFALTSSDLWRLGVYASEPVCGEAEDDDCLCVDAERIMPMSSSRGRSPIWVRSELGKSCSRTFCDCLKEVESSSSNFCEGTTLGCFLEYLHSLGCLYHSQWLQGCLPSHLIFRRLHSSQACVVEDWRRVFGLFLEEEALELAVDAA